MRSIFKAVTLLCAVALSACVSQHTMLRNDSGQTVHCQDWGFGVIGVPVALASHASCMKNYHAAGFHE